MAAAYIAIQNKLGETIKTSSSDRFSVPFCKASDEYKRLGGKGNFINLLHWFCETATSVLKFSFFIFLF